MSDEHDESLKREPQQPDSQDKDNMERVEKQDVSEEITTKTVEPNWTGDVRPNR